MAGEGLFGNFFLLGGRRWGPYLVGAAGSVRFRSVVFDGVRLCSVGFGQLVGPGSCCGLVSGGSEPLGDGAEDRAVLLGGEG